MTTKTLWGKRGAFILAVTGLALAQTQCRSTTSDELDVAGAANAAGMGNAGVSSAGDSSAGTVDTGAGSAGAAGEASAGAAGAGEGGAGGDAAGGAGGAGGDDAGADDAGAGGAPADGTLEFVSDRQLVPNSGSAFAADLDGDGEPDNAYGKVISALSVYGFPAQISADAETSAGRGLQLLAFEASDSSLVSGSTTLTLWRALPTNPDFTGTGSFVVDSAAPSASLRGIIESGTLTSVKFAPGEELPRMLLHLPFGGTVDLPVSVYSISFHVTANGLRQGQLNGAALASDVDAVLPPALAAAFDESCAGVAAPSQQCQTALLVLDANHDQSISAEELRESGLLKSALAPDVKLFDAQGKFAPDGAAVEKDALSLGFGFTAVQARITR